MILIILMKQGTNKGKNQRLKYNKQDRKKVRIGLTYISADLSFFVGQATIYINMSVNPICVQSRLRKPQLH